MTLIVMKVQVIRHQNLHQPIRNIKENVNIHNNVHIIAKVGIIVITTKVDIITIIAKVGIITVITIIINNVNITLL